MALVKKKTRKAIQRNVRKVIKKHGPEIATGIATGILSSLATLVGTESAGGDKKKKKKGKGSKLTDLLPSGKTLANLPGVKQVAEMLPGGDSKEKPHKKSKPSRPQKKAKPARSQKKRTRRPKKQTTAAAPATTS